MKSSVNPWIAVFALLAFSSCSKENYGYVQKQAVLTNQNFPVKEIRGSNAIDILWVVDNSGSMETYQQQLIDNTDAFMKDFIQEKLDWKMGLISTSESENPYIGFAGKAPLNSTTLDPVGVFGKAVARLGTNGSGIEKTFTPILQSLTMDPTFLRPNTPLAIIMVTDAPEQSRMRAPVFNAQLSNITQGRKILAYGAFAANDLGCVFSDSAWNYKESLYEGFITSVFAGQVFPLCKDFGSSLANIGHDIVTRVAHTAIYLSSRPDTSTLQVFYHDQPLPARTADTEGFWIYDYRLNAVVFNNLDFAQDENDSVRIVYEEES